MPEASNSSLGPHAVEFIPQSRQGFVSAKFRGAKIAGGKVHQGQTRRSVAPHHRSQIVVLPRLQHLRINGRARRHHARDLALDELFGHAGVFHLVANRHPEAPPDELGDITFGRVVRHAAHGNGRAFLLVARGEGDLEFLRGNHRIFKKQFVEIAQAKEQQGAGVALLDSAVLAHEGCGEFFHGFGGLAGSL